MSASTDAACTTSVTIWPAGNARLPGGARRHTRRRQLPALPAQRHSQGSPPLELQRIIPQVPCIFLECHFCALRDVRR